MQTRPPIKVFGLGCFPGADSSAHRAIDTFSSIEALSSNNASYVLFPGFCDVHVHFREPGFSYKETIKSGSMAAARGGCTAVCAMPNLDPVPDTSETLGLELDIIERDAAIRFLPYGAITRGEKGEELADMAAMAPYVCAFSDDGRGVQSDDMMRKAMQTAKDLDRPIAAHCEVNSLLRGGYIHDGTYAAAHGHKGLCSESEWRQIERDLRLAAETGCAYHVCHISCKESVALIREAKREGVNVTCETAPHYLLLDEGDLREDGRFRMNPPLREAADREALIEGIADGTIDMIATDHAPHSAEEKARGLSGSASGVVGIETAFPLIYTYLVERDVISLDRLIELMAVNPRKRFKIPFEDEFTIWDLNKVTTVDPKTFLSMGKATPFEGWQIKGECIATMMNGNTVYSIDPIQKA